MVAGQLGNQELCLQGLASALEFASAREPYSVVTCILSLRMVHMACLAHDEIDKETRDGLEELARKHLRMVYGPGQGVFEALNPRLSRELAALRTERVAEPEGEVTGGDAKRSRKE